MTFKNIMSGIMIICLLTVLSLPALAAELGPGKLVVQTIDRGIKILEDPDMQGNDKFVLRKERLWEILTPVFNFEETAKRCLGRYWKVRTEAERTEFISVFTQVLKEVYLGKTDQYSGGNFVYIREIVKGKRGKVRTNFITSDEKKVTVDFSMKQSSGNWRVYDITIEGVSMVGNYRSQFNTMLAKSTFKKLMKKLNDKKDEFDHGEIF